MGALVAHCARSLRSSFPGDAWREAEWLVLDLVPRLGQILGRESEALDPDEREAVCAALERRVSGVPFAHVVGHQEFFGRRFGVGPEVLIPRPDTECLVEEVLRRAPRGPIVDVGCGSGAIAITLALEMGPQVRCLGVDRSRAAIARAAANARALRAPVRFVVGDLLGAVRGPLGAVVANLPYVSRFEYPRLPREVLMYEPRDALEPRGDSVEGLRRRLIREAVPRLGPGGWLLLEVGAGQAGSAREDLRRAGLRSLAVIRDLAGIGRVVRGRRGLASAAG